MASPNRNEYFYTVISNTLDNMTVYDSGFNVNSDYDENYPYAIVFIGDENKEYLESEGYSYPVGGSTTFYIELFFKTKTSQDELTDLRIECHNWISRTEKVFNDYSAGVERFTDPITSEVIAILRLQLDGNIKQLNIDGQNTGVVAFKGEIEFTNHNT